MKQSIIILLLIQIAVSIDTCALKDFEKEQCGTNVRDQIDCVKQGCCWSPTKVENVPQCYKNIKDAYCTFQNFNSDFPGFDGAFQTIKTSFLNNINIKNKGGVVAAPDTNTPGGTYYFHWMRDAALSMKTYMLINDNQYQKIHSIMDKYVQWVQKAQNAHDPNRQSNLSEPKFYLPDGEIFDKEWCRPQTDGPGLRSTTLIHYAKILLKEGKKTEIAEKLWKKDGQGILQKDLEFVRSNWEEESCDLWEEIKSDNFFWNRMAFHQALTHGAEFAKVMDDNERYSSCKETAQRIKFTLLNHYNGKFIFESDNRLEDSSVIHALASLNEGVYDITGIQTANTIKHLNEIFCEEFPINRQQDQMGIPGILYGRYKGDTYAGGNPWQLLSASLADLFYQISEKYESMPEQILSNDEIQHWRNILDMKSDINNKDMAKYMRKAGDSVMYRIWTHISTRYNEISEQIDKNTGNQIAAKSLTWSYANILRVLHSHILKKPGYDIHTD